MRSEQEVCAAIQRYADTVRRIALLRLKNEADADDLVQTVFVKYALHEKQFADAAHEKAWMIRVAINAGHDALRSLRRRRTAPLEQAAEVSAPLCAEHAQVWTAVLSLPKAYRQAVYLFYYEGYDAPQIAAMTHRRVNTVYTHLARARKILRQKLGGNDDARTDAGSL